MSFVSQFPSNSIFLIDLSPQNIEEMGEDDFRILHHCLFDIQSLDKMMRSTAAEAATIICSILI